MYIPKLQYKSKAMPMITQKKLEKFEKLKCKAKDAKRIID
jgi:hypothetical protein